MIRRASLLAAIVVFALAGNSVAIGSEQTVWSGIIVASNSGPPDSTPPELTPVETTLRQVFGYNRFHLIAEARRTLKSGEEDWEVATKYFALLVDAQGQKAGAYVLNLKLLQEKKMLLETNAQLSKASPLVIRGPQVGDGQLVIVLVLE
jgi:hypothetical protein